MRFSFRFVVGRFERSFNKGGSGMGRQNSAFDSGFFGTFGVIFALIVFFVVFPLMLMMMSCAGCFAVVGGTAVTTASIAADEAEAEAKRQQDGEDRNQVAQPSVETRTTKTNETVTVLNAKGDADSKTEVFELSGSNPTIDFSFFDPGKSGLAAYSLKLYAEDGRPLAKLIDGLGDDKSGSELIVAPKGKYYLEVSASNCKWELQISEKRIITKTEKIVIAPPPKPPRQKTPLEAFEVVSASFAWEKSGFSLEPIINITVKNGTKHAISRAYFKGRLHTPGRSIPWVEDTFNYSIAGGLEPGESATWALQANRFSDWGDAPQNRNDMVLDVKVYKLDGANEETIAEAE